MKINFKKEFGALDGGDAFVYNDCAYIKMNRNLYEVEDGIYNALNLHTGMLVYFEDDDWVQALHFEGEWCIG